jgi:deazaflavin-dependent oxidoreductase (nitroreductase family)
LVRNVKLPRALAQFNRYVTNPLQRRWAGWLPGYAIVEHRGRKSGKVYRTPVVAFRTATGLAVPIGYGLDADWLKNLKTAGGGVIVHRGMSHAVESPEILSRQAAAARIEHGIFGFFGRMPIEHAAIFTYG